MNRLLFALRPARLERLESVIDVPIGNPEVEAARDAFRGLIVVHRDCSRYIKRVLGRVTERHPATVQAMSDDARLRTLALGRLAASERHSSPEKQKGLLGNFYDVEFLRVAMGTLRGEPVQRTRAAFAELTATYLGRLFDFCFREVEREAGGRTAERDRIAIFLSGGNARRRPNDEDYDLLALLDSEEPAARALPFQPVSPPAAMRQAICEIIFCSGKPPALPRALQLFRTCERACSSACNPQGQNQQTSNAGKID